MKSVYCGRGLFCLVGTLAMGCAGESLNSIESVAEGAQANTSLAATDAPSNPLDDSASDRDSSATSVGPVIASTQLDGVWVFHHSAEGSLQALHRGAAQIVDGCLYVGDMVVVWHADRVSEARDAIARVRAGETSELLIGGGGTSLDEGGVIPTVISEHCPTRKVWFSGVD